MQDIISLAAEFLPPLKTLYSRNYIEGNCARRRVDADEGHPCQEAGGAAEQTLNQWRRVCDQGLCQKGRAANDDPHGELPDKAAPEVARGDGPGAARHVVHDRQKY